MVLLIFFVALKLNLAIELLLNDFELVLQRDVVEKKMRKGEESEHFAFTKISKMLLQA